MYAMIFLSLVTPTALNVTGGTEVEFTCISAEATAINWRINESLIRDVIPYYPDIAEISCNDESEEQSECSKLTFTTMRATSTTSVTCEIAVSSTLTISERSTSHLMVQGE